MTGNSSAGGIAYGSIYKPKQTGSNGGGVNAGKGGGMAYIKVPAIILIDGFILADGADGSGTNGGGGSGGTILIEAGE